ncbi:hypothetical protein M8494_31985 [Serratia ureilytica]
MRRYTAKYGRFKDKTFDGAQFDNIVIYSTTALGDFMFSARRHWRAMRERYPNAHHHTGGAQENRELVKRPLLRSCGVLGQQDQDDPPVAEIAARTSAGFGADSALPPAL